jgi:hypothetical protein
MFIGGSEWRRWDLHVHTPETILNNQFGDWEEYLKTVEAHPDVKVLGVTDSYVHRELSSRTVRLTIMTLPYRLNYSRYRSRGSGFEKAPVSAFCPFAYETCPTRTCFRTQTIQSADPAAVWIGCGPVGILILHDEDYREQRHTDRDDLHLVD